jgi:hypothetical protein
MRTIPEIVTHNYDPGGVFLANLCDLLPADAEQVLRLCRKLYGNIAWSMIALQGARRCSTAVTLTDQ